MKPESASEPSPGSLGHLDRAFVDWTSRLVHKGLLERHHWSLECPGYLSGCCPVVKPLDDDPEVLNQLTDMSPAYAFAYVFGRRLAEFLARLSSCWLLPGLLLVLIFSTCRTWQNSGRPIIYGRDTTATWWSPKNIALILSVVMLSILAPTLAENTFGGVYNYQLQWMEGWSHTSPSFSLLKPWKVTDVMRPVHPLSLLNLLDFVRLHHSLYGPHHSPVGNASALCRQTALSLSCWSVLVFVGTAYAVVTFAFRALVWRPLKSIIFVLATNKSVSHQTFKDRRSEKSNLFENSEILFCEKILEKSGDKRLPVRPRYVSRGVYACLDSDEYALRD